MERKERKRKRRKGAIFEAVCVCVFASEVRAGEVSLSSVLSACVFLTIFSFVI